MKRYPKIRAIYASNGDADDDSLPPIKDKDDLRRRVGLGIVHVLDTAKAGHAYVGFEMGCTWDEEHGLGVLTHKGRVIAIGEADAAFDSGAARKDGGKPIGAPPRKRR